MYWLRDKSIKSGYFSIDWFPVNRTDLRTAALMPVFVRPSGQLCQIQQSQRCKFLPSLGLKPGNTPSTTCMTLTSHHSRLCAIGCQGGGTRKVPKTGICHVYIRASCHPIGQSHGTRWRRRYTRQEIQKILTCSTSGQGVVACFKWNITVLQLHYTFVRHSQY